MLARLTIWWSAEPAVRPGVTPDGLRYMKAYREPVARPYYFRWLLCLVCKDHLRRWIWLSRGSVIALAPLAWWYTGSPWMMACVFLPGIMILWHHPVLVDAEGMALALLAACLWPICWPVSIILVLVAGMVRETSPLWAAIWAWNPVLLIGLVPVAIRWLTKTEGYDAEFDWYLKHPIKAGLAEHRPTWNSPRWMITPWAGLIFGVAVLSPWTVDSTRLAVALVCAYGQLLLAVDTVRIYTYAWPSLALACTQALPPQWLPFIALSIIFNPWR